MMVSQEDTSALRTWLSAQLKRGDVPGLVWEHLVNKRYVADALDSDYPAGRGELVAEARALMKIAHGDTSVTTWPKRPRRARSKKATNRQRAEVVAQIRAKFAQAKSDKVPDAPSDNQQQELEELAPEMREFLARTRALEDSPLRGEISNNRITVTAEPWVFPDEVRRQFEEMQRAWFWTRTPSERRVELVGFVVDFCGASYNEEHDRFSLTRGPEWPGWRGIMERWNQRYPQPHNWHYAEPRNLQRDFDAAAEALLRHEEF